MPRFSFVATILFSRRRFPFRGDDSLFAATIVFSWRRFPFRGDDSLFAATILFSRRRLSFRGDDSLFAATILFSWRLIDMGCRLCQKDFSPIYRAATCFSRRRISATISRPRIATICARPRIVFAAHPLPWRRFQGRVKGQLNLRLYARVYHALCT